MLKYDPVGMWHFIPGSAFRACEKDFDRRGGWPTTRRKGVGQSISGGIEFLQWNQDANTLAVRKQVLFLEQKRGKKR